MDWGLNARQPGQPTARALWSDHHHPGYFTLLLRRIVRCPGCAKSGRGRNTYLYLDPGCNSDAAEYAISIPHIHTAALHHRQPHSYPICYTDNSAYRQTFVYPNSQPHSNPDPSAANLYCNSAAANCHLAAADCHLATAHRYRDDAPQRYSGASDKDQYPRAQHRTD
jgi:hypothetical protein